MLTSRQVFGSWPPIITNCPTRKPAALKSKPVRVIVPPVAVGVQVIVPVETTGASDADSVLSNAPVGSIAPLRCSTVFTKKSSGLSSVMLDTVHVPGSPVMDTV